MNQLVIQALVKEISAVRYSPSGVPILQMILFHESEQLEAENLRKVSVTIDAIIIGQNALGWQHEHIKGKEVEVTGFLAQKHQRNPKPVLHIQSINFSKG